MRTSESIGKVSTALCEFQKEVKDTFKSAKGYGYNYATLDGILKDNRPLLTKNGLSFTQSEGFRDGGVLQYVEGRIIHLSGEWIETTSEAPFQQLKGMNSYQSAGAGFSYLRRYNISAMIGISSDEDIDASGEESIKTETLSGYLKAKNINAKDFVSYFMIQAAQAKELLNNKPQIDAMIVEFNNRAK